MYDFHAQVLLLGTSFESMTAFHLAEYRIPQQDLMTRGAPILEKGWRVWKEYQDIITREELFEQIGTVIFCNQEASIITVKSGLPIPIYCP
nr:AAC(3) family N-acetyltransferase [Bacillus safensis]